MAPHRLGHLTSAGGSIAAAAASPVGAVLAVLWSILTGLNALAFGCLLCVMLLDLATGITRASTRPDELFVPDVGVAGVWKKLGRVALVATALVLNAVLVIMSHASGVLRGVFDDGWIVMASIGALVAVEVASIIRNISRTDRAAVRAVWGVFAGALRAMRGLDDTKHRQMYGTPAPRRRHTDAAAAEMEIIPPHDGEVR